MEPRIRDAEPGDARFLAWVMQEAARSHLERGIWDLGLPDDAERTAFLAAIAIAEPACFQHVSNFLVAEIDGRQVAALSGYEPKTGLPRIPEAQLAAVRALGWEDRVSAEIGERIGSIAGAFPDTPDEHWVVEWVATVPEFRGRGIVSLLLERILARGRARGYGRAQIGYLLGNEPARRVYLRAGFADVDEKRDAEFAATLGCPGIARMLRDL